jgi:seryl-tRNA synthetase
MIDIKLIRQDLKQTIEILKKRNNDYNLEEILILDEKLRELQTQSQNLSALRNKLAKEIGILKANGKDASELLEEVSKSKNKEEELVSLTKDVENQINEKLLNIPNLPHSSVPQGLDEKDNVEVFKWGTTKKFNFTPKEHFDLGENLGMMDFEVASKMSGSRFVVLKDELSQLERAIGALMLDLHTKHRGYTEYSVPVLLNENMLYNTGQLPKFREDLFKTEDKWLISTTEIPLTNMVADSILDKNKLPLRFCGLSLCFRSEAGSSGRDTKGMIRQHQFYKVELVSITTQEQSYEELEYMRQSAEIVLQTLKLPYKVVLLCGGDMGFASAKTYDLEVWLPGQNTYREISSCSNCEDFQARRMLARYKNDAGKNTLVHTLNGSGLAVGRTLVAILENYQQEDGSIEIPEALIPYMNGKTIINKKN